MNTLKNTSNKSPLVSIIVPVFNVEKYIKRCLTSILQQDYHKIEVIVINDGSPDKSQHIVEELSKLDNRITLINQDNKGVSASRNEGIKRATGDYITFIDGDDWVESNYISFFLSLIIKYGCDVAMNMYNYVDDKQEVHKDSFVVKSEKAIEWIYCGKIFVAVWNKMFKRSFLERRNIRFNESLWYGEGMLFNIDALQLVDMVAIGRNTVYHQVSNISSAMRQFSLKSSHCGIESLHIQKGHWVKKNNKIVRAWKYHLVSFDLSIMRGLSSTGQMSANYLEYFSRSKNLRKNLLIFLLYSRNLKSILLAIAFSFFPKITGCFIEKKHFSKYAK